MVVSVRPSVIRTPAGVAVLSDTLHPLARSMAGTQSPPRTLALLPAAILAVAGWTWGGVAAGWAWGSVLGGLTGFVIGGLVGVMITALVGYSRAQAALREPPAPVIDTLPPSKALALLSAAAGAGRDGPGGSEVLAELDEIRSQAAANPGAALLRADALRKRHPRSPAVTAELARLHGSAGRDDKANELAGESVRLALDGGMNPVAASLFEEFSASREHLGLDARLLERLALALDARGSDELATWCRKQPPRE